MNIKSYLKRINYGGSLIPTPETLRELQIAHLLTVPFENLSIHSKEDIVLETKALFNKIVERRRGGFCYVLKGLFATLLIYMGFRVEMLAAEVATENDNFGPSFDHMTLMVTLEQRWLVDVGFGDSFREPLLLDQRGEQLENERACQIVSDGNKLILKHRGIDGAWKTQYRFALQPYEFADYEEMCRYHQTSAQSHFTQKRICSQATKEGRISLSEMRFIKTLKNGERKERVLSGQEEYAGILREHFGIIMTN
jgi:N-hydroxyarylamine O-acetyltransferase